MTYFWDLQRLEAYQEFLESLPSLTQFENHENGKLVNEEKLQDEHKNDEIELRDSATYRIPSFLASSKTDSTEGLTLSEIRRRKASWDKKYDAGQWYEQLQPHSQAAPRKRDPFPGRDVAWSNDGKWCVAVGSFGGLMIMRRWK